MNHNNKQNNIIIISKGNTANLSNLNLLSQQIIINNNKNNHNKISPVNKLV